CVGKYSVGTGGPKPVKSPHNTILQRYSSGVWKQVHQSLSLSLRSTHVPHPRFVMIDTNLQVRDFLYCLDKFQQCCVSSKSKIHGVRRNHPASYSTIKRFTDCLDISEIS